MYIDIWYYRRVRPGWKNVRETSGSRHNGGIISFFESEYTL